MAVYLCFECDTLVDGDYHPCEAHPKNSAELICDDCLVEFTDERAPERTRYREAEMNRMIKEIENDCTEAE